MLRGAIAAAGTPLTADGSELDEDAIAPLVRFLAESGIDGALVLGTTGEGVMFSVDERRRVAERFLEARPDGFAIAVHCGAQSTRDTVALAAQAGETRADAVAVIAPPYFAFDERACSGTSSRPRRATRSRSTSTSSPGGAATPSRSSGPRGATEPNVRG